MSGVYSRGKQKGTIEKLEDGRFVLDIDKRVKVSNHRNVFKEWEVLEKYLTWLFDGKYEIKPSL